MSIILERYEIARRNDLKGHFEGKNCIGAAFFLAGIDDEEIYRKTGDITKQSDRIIPVDTFAGYDDRVHRLIGYEASYIKNKGQIDHLLVIHPYDETKIIHRPASCEPMRMHEKETFWKYLQNTKRYRVALFIVLA